MSENDTLLSYLVPALTTQVEDAATDALGYVLSKSPRSMQALNDLLREGGFDIEPISVVKTQVAYKDGSRPDMTGYDRNGVKRLLVEAKFWAALLEGQASDYARQFDHCEKAVLLFIAPQSRIPTLWAEIRRQMEEHGKLEPIPTRSDVQRARVTGTQRHVVLVSWVGLLGRVEALAGDDDIKSDIRQIRGLAQLQDTEAFLPIRAKELSPNLGRRAVGYKQLVDDVVDSKGVHEGWMNIRGMRATPQSYGYGRYFRLTGVPGDCWFGVNHERWARSGDTPLWLLVSDDVHANMDEIGRELNVEVQDRWIPIHPRVGVEYTEVLDDVVSQLKTIAKIVGVRPELLLDDAL